MGRPKDGYYIGEAKPMNRVPSVTTVLGSWGDPGGLVHWAYSRGRDGKPRWPTEAVNAGNLAHAMVEDDLRGRMPSIPGGTDPDVTRAATAGFEAYCEWREGVQFEAQHLETPLVHRVLRYAGTLDAAGIANGRRALCDWKLTGGTYSNHVYQLAAYMELWEHNHPELSTLERFYSLRFGKGDPDDGDPGGDFHHHSFTRDQMLIALDAWRNILQAYQAEKTVRRWVK